MALTHAQRGSMFNALAQAMGQDDAETLMQHLPPSGWDNVATKEDLRAGFAETNAAIAAGLAQAAVERTAQAVANPPSDASRNRHTRSAGGLRRGRDSRAATGR